MRTDEVDANAETDDALGTWVVNAAPTSRWPALRLGDLWTSRELILTFAVRDIKARYKQALLGLAWAGIQPVIGALTFTLLFHRLADIDVGGDRSYYAFALVGFGVWSYFSTTVTGGTSSLRDNADLLTKVSFPRIVIPASTFLLGLVDLGVAVVLGFAAARVSRDSITVEGVLLGLPLGAFLLLAAVAGPVLFLSATVVKYRDAAVLVTFGLQFLLFASPVAYPPELVPERWRILVYANPLSGALGLLRSAFCGSDLPSAPQILLSLLAGAAAVMIGLLHFRRSEREFADII